jgi:protein involved in polysaccharide export with SLBB domain/Tfp pilus assembly protein PilF
MNKVIISAFLSLCVASSASTGLGQKTPQTSKQTNQSGGNGSALSNNDSIAKSDLNSARVDEASDAQRRYDSAIALSEAGKFTEAITALKELLKLQPQDPQIHFGMGMAYSKGKAYKDALDSFKKAVRYKPDWPEAHFRLGVVSYVLGKKSESTDEYKTLVQLNSQLGNLLYRIINEDNPNLIENAASTDPNSMLAKPAPEANAKSEPTATTNRAQVNSDAAASPTLTDIYKVGIGDILDIRFLNAPSMARSTLFTVVAGGMIDFPVAGGPIMVAGLSPEEIQTKIAAELKRRAVEENAQLSVGVRQYVSHSVMITGLVAAPGTRILRREAVPLYVVLAESQLRNDAGRITIMRGGAVHSSLDLNDPLTMNATVGDGDVITVTSRPQEYYYIAGRINYPGQKNFQSGITLLQAILAAGGTAKQNESLVEISREGTDGRLVTTQYNLKEIKAGKVGDPKLQTGDRIQVVR